MQLSTPLLLKICIGSLLFAFNDNCTVYFTGYPMSIRCSRSPLRLGGCSRIGLNALRWRLSGSFLFDQLWWCMDRCWLSRAK